MDFFQSQDDARKNTSRLIGLFALAVIALILVTNLLVIVLFGLVQSDSAAGLNSDSFVFDWRAIAAVSSAVLCVIVLGSAYKVSSLSGGGAVIAEAMGGRLVPGGTAGFKERRLLNVVEEMAIASGTPVPPVYIIEEPGINAFAAGYSASDAVIGITRGAVDSLSRQQLQGVIGHEFSHILHGDMRINIRLIGILHGILVLGIIGYYLMRGSSHSRSKNSGGLVLLGLGLVVIGYAGTFFGNLIKAAVSRQREFLADASAVQYTRNPEGIAGALMRIALNTDRSFLVNSKANEISHMLFEEGQVSSLGGLYATHPPLDERIMAILPEWDGSYELADLGDQEQAEPAIDAQPEEGVSAAQESTPSRRTVFLASILAAESQRVTAGQAIESAGNPGENHLADARALLQALPEFLIDAAHEPAGARAIIYLLVVSAEMDMRREQLAFIAKNGDAGVFEELTSLLSKLGECGVESVPASIRLSLVDIAMPGLRQLSQSQFGLFRQNFNKLIEWDSKIQLFEWCIQKVVFHHLLRVFGGQAAGRLGVSRLGDLGDECGLLLSVFAYSEAKSPTDAKARFDHAAAILGLSKPIVDAAAISMRGLDSTLGRLANLKVLEKPSLLKALVACIEYDGTVSAREFELVRAVAAILDCPLPPISVKVSV